MSQLSHTKNALRAAASPDLLVFPVGSQLVFLFSGLVGAIGVYF